MRKRLWRGCGPWPRRRDASSIARWQSGPAGSVGRSSACRKAGLAIGRSALEQLCTEGAKAPARVVCSCGGTAGYKDRRSAVVQTTVGRVILRRAYYRCGKCRRGFAPLDEALGLCAGSVSRDLAEVLALFGAVHAFREAVQAIGTTLFVQVSPAVCRRVTEELGDALARAERAAEDAVFALRGEGDGPPPADAPQDLYVTMDGVLANQTEDGWTEVKLARVYTTRRVRDRKRPDIWHVRAADSTYVADIAVPAVFGRAVYTEAHRRGVIWAKRVVVLGDGAHWIWLQAAEHFPDAILILDWYHASGYVWNVAKAVYGEGTDLCHRWANARLTALWDGKVAEVIADCQAHADDGPAIATVVHETVTYFTNNAARMDYPTYRAMGLQIGSGSIESACKHVVAARLKQAGMRWSPAGARAMVKVRTWLRGNRWDEAKAHQPQPYRRRKELAA